MGQAEQLLLMEKLTLLKAVRVDPMISSVRPPVSPRLLFLWSLVALLAAGVALVAEAVTSPAVHPYLAPWLTAAWIVALAASAILLFVALFLGLRNRQRAQAA
jgi:anti-sigma factor RsiW